MPPIENWRSVCSFPVASAFGCRPIKLPLVDVYITKISSSPPSNSNGTKIACLLGGEPSKPVVVAAAAACTLRVFPTAAAVVAPHTAEAVAVG